MKTVILGTGSWGTALAQVLTDNGQPVLLWGRNSARVDEINNEHRSAYFPDVILSSEIKATTDLSYVKDADIVLLAVPTGAVEETLERLKEHLDKPVIIINTAKGFHPQSHKRLYEVIAEVIPPCYRQAIISLLGPSHAEEVIIRKLTCINSVSYDEACAELIQNLFANDYFRVYRSNDVIGCEIGVALKNIMAIASGCLEGIGQGDNAKAALMTRGLAEMTRYGMFFHARPETFLGLDGVGDLIVTCTSRHSRNFQAGLAIGKADEAVTFMGTNTATVEGIPACKAVYEEAEKNHIDMPITNQLYQVLYEGKKPSDAISDLMSRRLKAED